MHAPDSAGGEDLYPGKMGDYHSGGDGGGSVLSPCHQDWEITAGGLGDGPAFLSKILNFVGWESCL